MDIDDAMLLIIIFLYKFVEFYLIINPFELFPYSFSLQKVKEIKVYFVRNTMN